VYPIRRPVVYLGRERDSPLALLLGWSSDASSVGSHIDPSLALLLAGGDDAAPAATGDSGRPTLRTRGRPAQVPAPQSLSRRHCALVYERGRAPTEWAVLNFSKNGTLVDGVRVGESGAPLYEGSVVTVAGIQVCSCFVRPPPSPTQAHTGPSTQELLRPHECNPAMPGLCAALMTSRRRCTAHRSPVSLPLCRTLDP